MPDPTPIREAWEADPGFHTSPPANGWLWRPHAGSRRWSFTQNLDNRHYPADAEFVPIRFLAEPITFPSRRKR